MTSPQPQRAFVGVHLLMIQDNCLFLTKRLVKNSMYGMYALVAGKVDQFESPRDALVREAREEIGVILTPESLDHVTTVHHAQSDYKLEKHDVIEFYFLAKEWQGTPVNHEPDKIHEIGFFPMDALPTPLPRGLTHALEALKTGQRFIELRP